MARKKYCIFDMDGTLTDAMHDFPAIKQTLGLPLELDILTGISRFDLDTQVQKHKELNEIELNIAKQAQAAIGVDHLLTSLRANKVSLGILTRNSYVNTLATLEAANLLHFFDDSLILTRDHAEPKPHPQGILQLQQKWGAESAEMLMVGDYLYDLLAGKAANTETVYIDTSGEFKYKEHATYLVTQMDQILDLDLF
jgi:HAD superfamily hydrolase (TIGR01509 family)